MMEFTGNYEQDKNKLFRSLAEGMGKLAVAPDPAFGAGLYYRDYVNFLNKYKTEFEAEFGEIKQIERPQFVSESPQRVDPTEFIDNRFNPSENSDYSSPRYR
ncbi:MAG: hypothetical protein KME10_27955 [Plectolyngbya sp. WJT66-NPBG17]|jgi:hypothetical protein|nr:hypothetical protein [Plectolyngbya sp. WJT66-NPBG17]